MVRSGCLFIGVVMGLALAATGTGAQVPAPAVPTPAVSASGAPGLAERAARRFPQPVRVGDLIARQVLQPTEAQAVLGRVAAIVRHGDGSLAMVVRFGGVLGVGARPIAVPIEAVALLGEYVAVMDFTPQQLQDFPTASAAGAAPLGPDEIIRVGLARPFH